MKYNINLFGNNVDCFIDIQDEKLTITLPDNEQKSLKSYLERVLLKYGQQTEHSNSLESLVSSAIEVEKNISGHMSEPKIKLPYEFNPEIKEKLIEAAALQELSATQLLIKIIENKYQEVFNDK